MRTEKIVFNDTISRQFIWATVLWGIVGMLVGVLIATQLAYWPIIDTIAAGIQWALAKMHLVDSSVPWSTQWLTFGRLRPLHTNAVIFAFVGNMMFAGVYYSTQRLLKVRLPSDWMGSLHFWGWQLIIIVAAITLPLGLTQGKEYAELEWPIDILITIIWVVFAINFFWMLIKRNEKQIYVAIWFYIASIVTVAVLHIVNNISIPLGLFKSYSVFAGVQDALVQWWYGHNAVAFFLTTPILGIMYYYMPKAIGKPVYSYRLSIIHFWTLVFLYIWAGPHHLLNTSLPDWAQTLGMVFSIALWAPSWGGMINGLLTLRGAWHKLRTDPVVAFFAAAVTFYGMATFEGPLLSIKSVNALAHNTDWIIGHVHGGALGWNGFMAAGMMYWMVPRLFNTKLFSTKMAFYHFWIGLFGIMLYMAAMYISGIQQGLMWGALNAEGTLMYPQFLEAITKSQAMYMLRAVGGGLYLLSFIMMGINLIKTAKSGEAVNGEMDVVVEEKSTAEVSWKRLVFSPTMFLLIIGVVLLIVMGMGDLIQTVFALVSLAFVMVVAFLVVGAKSDMPGGKRWHEVLERHALLFTIFTLIAILIGGMVEIVPAVIAKGDFHFEKLPPPYTALELEGRDIYLREGCYNCHTEMVRPLVSETMRYGERSQSWEYAYDHPFQWGSKRTGPDLMRVGGKYPDLWHYKHMIDPRSTSPGSIMPSYAFMEKTKLDVSRTSDKLMVMKKMGVPYSDEEIERAKTDAMTQAMAISDRLAKDGVTLDPESELSALIAYLQRLGKNETGGK